MNAAPTCPTCGQPMIETLATDYRRRADGVLSLIVQVWVCVNEHAAKAA